MGILHDLAPLWRRYKDIFSEAWKERRSLDAPKRSTDELNFLPSALSLRDTPVNPAPRILAWGIIIMFSLALIWSFVGRMDVIASGRGKVVPGSGSKIVQAAEVSVVKSIYVKDGQKVAKGDKLIQLDDKMVAADVERFEAQIAAKRIDHAIATSVLKAMEDHSQPESLRSKLADLPQEDISQADIRLLGRYQAMETAIEEKNAELRQLDTQLAASKASLDGLEQVIPITRELSASLESLTKKDFVSRSQFLGKEQERLVQERSLIDQKFEVEKTSSSRDTSQRQKDNLISRWRQEMLDLQSTSAQDVQVLGKELVKARRRQELMMLVAPVDGTVQELAIKTEGGVVTEAQPLMTIVPTKDPIEIEAMLPNKDVGFVRPGLQVEVKVDAFEFTKYGLVLGTISTLSTDSIEMENVGPVFAMRILVDEVPEEITIAPGMSITAEVKIGSRKIIEYFLSPLNVYLHDSLRER
ncbi:HlyD family type I secretion periplasmic adaptor subunit [Aureimonas fodinaquatilis]|uniref:Membrane fusion protein (MFP) family protein n=1 Tax=Aureimonas fodinaquatilis TaxID=2565783 RepID=A0A5B0E0N8_9HYPH|nr:HlyD family type I secretion periplasmic adaptor subunit [Aureimonas fodinaquatilis]KAA0972236.1 HlyD family type I secretion periplasmic adaptor subunit [Aureimonas fodinaquatilis]